jgi:hypothetical protein
MILNIFKDASDWFAKTTAPIRDFFIENARNPFLWVSIILVGLLVFELTYRSLHKDS